jgi:hypothetical protein
MKKENRWSHGTKNFVLPVWPNDLKGRHGCALHRITFDASVGEEVCAIYMEEPDFADQYSKVVPFNLIVHSGLVRTPYGVVAFLVWQIAASSPQEVMAEQYLNPQNIGTVRLIASAANQTHVKLVVVNNQSGEVAAFIDYENVFRFDELVSTMATAIGHEPEGDFGAATQHVMNNFTIAELLACSANSPG